MPMQRQTCCLMKYRNYSPSPSKEKSAAARKTLSQREADLANAGDRARTLRERRDQLATASARRRLDAIEQTLTENPLDVQRANTILREAIERMVMFPAEGRLVIYWRHAHQPQETVFFTSRFDWGANAKLLIDAPAHTK